jgi:hypothetical protein
VSYTGCVTNITRNGSILIAHLLYVKSDSLEIIFYVGREAVKTFENRSNRYQRGKDPGVVSDGRTVAERYKAISRPDHAG